MNMPELKSQIERTTSSRNLCVRFSAFEVWIDADDYCAEPSMKDFLQNHCELTEEQAHNLVNGDYIFVDAEDLAECFLKGTSFDAVGYENASRYTMRYSEDAVRAAVALGIDMDCFSDAYRGSYASFEAFAEELFDETLLESVPKPVRQYIDYKAYARDLDFNGDYSHHDGHVFASRVQYP